MDSASRPQATAMRGGTSAAMVRNNHAGKLLRQLNTHGGNYSRSSAFSALPHGLSGGLGLPEFPPVQPATGTGCLQQFPA